MNIKLIIILFFFDFEVVFEHLKLSSCYVIQHNVTHSLATIIQIHQQAFKIRFVANIQKRLMNVGYIKKFKTL